jgi:hypothetical protein
MSTAGWKVEREIPVTKILGKSLNINYGDVDVLAWSASTGRVLLIECKDLHFHKTPGELAEQLSDFRGKTRDGKRDLLKRHLDRSEVISAHVDQISAYLRLPSKPVIEGHVVFRNPVPMLFAWNGLKDRIKITTYEHLDRI